MKEAPQEEQPRTVRELERGGEIRARWSWVEPAVWTERMLEALEGGVRGGKWHSLIDKVYRKESLQAAWEQVRERKGCGGVDGVTLQQFEAEADRRIETISQALREERYEPKPVRRAWIPKGGGKLRPLGIPVVADRVVQTSLRNAVEPIFEKKFADCSYGFRPNRGCKDALRAVSQLLKDGFTWVVDVDVEQYFDSIRKDLLMREIASEIADGSVLDLIEGYLDQKVIDGMKIWTPEAGTPQGAVISPLLANIYLHPVDQAMTERSYQIVRYADDMVILCQSREEAEGALGVLRELLGARGLRLHPAKTRVVDATVRPGFDFLGYRFCGRYRDPRPSSQKKLRDSIRTKTLRTSGEDLPTIIREVNRTLRGWFEYFKNSSRHAFDRLDPWVRMRLRSILRKRTKRHGQGRGWDHFRWPDAYFRELGLFSLVEAHEQLLRPALQTTNRRAGCGRSARPVRREGER